MNTNPKNYVILQPNSDFKVILYILSYEDRQHLLKSFRTQGIPITTKIAPKDLTLTIKYPHPAWFKLTSLFSTKLST